MSAETTRAMEEWAPHLQLSLAQARTRTKIVRYLRFALLASAIITIGIFLGYVARNAYQRAGTSGSTVNDNETVTMLNPRFTGRDGAGNLYVITSASAQQRRDNEDLIDLVEPKLVDFFGREVTAPRGLYDRVEQTLDLYENVLVVDTEGYVFNSTHAKVFPQTGVVTGVEPLDGTGPIGDIRSDSYELSRETGIVSFKGNVVTVLFDQED